MADQMVVVELCLSQSVGSRYCEPTVRDIRTVTREEADRLLETKMAPRHFWRVQEDRTGN